LLKAVRVWKLVINRTTERGIIEKLLEKACTDVMRKAVPEGPFALIERIDLREKDNETIVFLRANEGTVREFQNAIQLQKLQVKEDILEMSKNDIVRAQ
jgi:hypothetical protein